MAIDVTTMSDRSLKSIIATLNPDGFYAPQFAQAKAELDRREIDYSDCLS